MTARESPEDALLRMHHEGSLATNYPLVAGLTARLSSDALLRAGQLLSKLDPDELTRRHPETRSVTVALTGHGMIAPLVAPLTAELARHGLLLRPTVGNFGSYVVDLSAPNSELYAPNPDLVLCLLDPMIVADELPVPWRLDDAERVLAEKVHLIEGLVGQFEAITTATLVLNTVPLPHDIVAQLVDFRSRARLGRLWRDANARLLDLAERHSAVVVLDLDPMVAEGIAASDARLSVYGKVHLPPPLLARYAREVGHLARHLTGRNNKCLVLDLDGTVWGGVLGEDGPDGIEVADTYRGEAFRAFQRVIKQLGSQGVLVAAVSKNDAELVSDVFRAHPRMTLRAQDMVRVTANWRPKHENIAALAQSLNLGTDSFVFVDDTIQECELVRSELPGVTVLRVNAEPASHVGTLLADSWFAVRQLASTDRTRATQYRDELARGNFLQKFDSIDDYLRELCIAVRMSVATGDDVPRLSQLTLRTNQFNLTTRRMQPADIQLFMRDPATRVLAVDVQDRFGPSGTVGAVFLRDDGNVLRVENFLLSCRVFSRGIEHACLAAILRHARATGASALLGEYRQSPKNGMVRDFYTRYGFTRVDGDGDGHGHGHGQRTIFRHDLRNMVAPPDHIQLTEQFDGGPP